MRVAPRCAQLTQEPRRRGAARCAPDVPGREGVEPQEPERELGVPVVRVQGASGRGLSRVRSRGEDGPSPAGRSRGPPSRRARRLRRGRGRRYSRSPSPPWFARGSTSTPRNANPSAARSRTSGERSPTPPVNASASMPSERGRHRGDPAAQRAQVDVQGQAASGSPARAPREDLGHVGAARQAEQARAVLERVGEIVGLDRLVLEQPEDHAGVDAAGAGGHHQALERCEAHRRVDRAPAGDRAQRRARRRDGS